MRYWRGLGLFWNMRRRNQRGSKSSRQKRGLKYNCQEELEECPRGHPAGLKT